MPIVHCKDCGTAYEAKVSRDGYCENCRARRIAETKHKYYESRKQDMSAIRRKLIACEGCGEKILPKNKSVRFCRACQLRNQQKSVNQASNQYRSEHHEMIQFKVYKGQRDNIKRFAREQGMSVSELIYTGLSLAWRYLCLSESERRRILLLMAEGCDKEVPYSLPSNGAAELSVCDMRDYQKENE